MRHPSHHSQTTACMTGLATHVRASGLPVIEPLETRVLLSAGLLDLTAAGAYGMVNDAIFRQVQPGSTGTGVVDAFVRMQGAPYERGYNTSGTTEFETKADAHTHPIQLSAVPSIEVGNTLYREMWLDLNEPTNTALVTLEDFQVFVGTAGSYSGYPFAGQIGAGQMSLIYDMDAGPKGDTYILLDGSKGSGQGDMTVYIPDALFGVDDAQYVYVYSSFGVLPGADHGETSEGGYEEWFVGKDADSLSITVSIYGYKFNDANGDGEDNDGPDNRLSGWTFFLDDNDNGQLDDGEMTAVTDANGQYAFPNLLIGLTGQDAFRVREDLQPGWKQTAPDVDPDIVVIEDGGLLVQGGSVFVAYSGQVVLEPEEVEIERPDLAFGNARLMTVSGYKFQDHDGNGEWDGDDAGLEGWTIYLFLDDGDGIFNETTPDAQTTTNENGYYEFENLLEEDYWVREELRTGWMQITGSPDLIGSTAENVNFGNFDLFDISGRKFEDMNGDGSGAGDLGLAGWTIELYEDSDDD
ncbi:hypothetical protein LCGC14_1703790, partial [marine sediment metagenome]